jgi:hypothetical protein
MQPQAVALQKLPNTRFLYVKRNAGVKARARII